MVLNDSEWDQNPCHEILQCKQGELLIRVFNSEQDKDGWGCQHTIVKRMGASFALRMHEDTGATAADGVPKTLAMRAASLHLLYPALDVVEAAAQRDADVLEVASVFYSLGDKLRLKWLRGFLTW